MRPRGSRSDRNTQACHTWSVQQIPGVHKTPLAKGTRRCHPETDALVSGLCSMSQETLPPVHSSEINVSPSTLLSPSWKSICPWLCTKASDTCEAKDVEAGSTGTEEVAGSLRVTLSPALWRGRACRMHWTSSQLSEAEVVSEETLPSELQNHSCSVQLSNCAWLGRSDAMGGSSFLENTSSVFSLRCWTSTLLSITSPMSVPQEQQLLLFHREPFAWSLAFHSKPYSMASYINSKTSLY